MPPRKEPKEAVVYPASKRKAPPFKPQRPMKHPRIPTTESESSTRTTVPAGRKSAAHENDESGNEDSDEELPENALDRMPRRPTKGTTAALSKRKSSRQPSPMSISSQESSTSLQRAPPTARDHLPAPSQSDGVQVISQPLLVRLLHHNFVDSSTKIDKHAIQVLGKYFEIFVRESIARASMQKKEQAAKGEASQTDVNWLELEDLEKVAAGAILDF